LGVARMATWYISVCLLDPEKDISKLQVT
jgi:hypothetical protein